MGASGRKSGIFKVTIIGGVVKFLIFVIKLLAGIFGRSTAMVADSLHSLSDLLTDFIVLAFVGVASRKPDNKFPYGYGKFETLASLIIGLILFGVGVSIIVDNANLVSEALNGLELERPTYLALIVAALSVIIREALYHYTIARGRRLKSAPVIANAWHHRADALTSAATLLAIAGSMFLGEKWRVLDPIAAIAVGALVVKVGVQVIIPAVAELLERSLDPEELNDIEQLIKSVDGAEALHLLRTRRLGGNVAIDAHVDTAPEISLADAEKISSRIEQRLHQRYGEDAHISVHMHPRGTHHSNP